jgi:hypothetical protein
MRQKFSALLRHRQCAHVIPPSFLPHASAQMLGTLHAAHHDCAQNPSCTKRSETYSEKDRKLIEGYLKAAFVIYRSSVGDLFASLGTRWGTRENISI